MPARLLPPTSRTVQPLNLSACSRRMTREGPSGMRAACAGTGQQGVHVAPVHCRTLPSMPFHVTGNDDLLETLLLPFDQRALTWPESGGALFLGARAGAPLQRRSLPGLVCAQDFRPEVDALQRAGLPLVDAADEGRYQLVLLLPPRQREQARALYARALDRLAPGGRVLACVANNEGARSAEEDLRRLAGPLSSLSKN